LGGLIKTVDHDKMREESEKALDRLNIRLPSLTQQVLNLSGGQRQAVAIARSIYWNAKLMIMDEPTAALGVSEQRKVLRLVKTLCDQGVPVIIISHNMQDVFAVATRLVVMRRGKKVGERLSRNLSRRNRKFDGGSRGSTGCRYGIGFIRYRLNLLLQKRF
jgi:ABC-type sugar transport system ATPase subunit